MSNRIASAAQGMIDAKIEKLRKQIQVLHRDRNDLSPVNRLPCDIILMIFQQLIPDLDFDIAVNFNSRHPGFPGNLLNVTHVSQRWRTLALESSGLWSRIVSPPFRFANEMIARSRDACLEVDVRGHAAKRFLPRVFGQLIRIRVLAIDLSFRNAREPGLEELDRPAPLLETLSLRHAVLPRRLFAGQCQKLKRVYLRQCAFHWSPEIYTSFHNLIALQVSRCDIRLSSGLPSLLVVLETMPLLRKLQLEHPFSGMLDNLGIAKFSRPVVMPSLIDLEFVDLERECVWFLEHTTFPKVQTCCFGIHDSYDSTTSIRPSDVCNTIRKSFQHLQGERPWVFIDLDCDKNMSAHTGMPPEDTDGSSGDIKPQLQLEVEYWSNFLPELHPILHPQYVRAISLGHSECLDEEVLGEFLASFRNIQECTIYRDDVTALLLTLAMPRRNEENGMKELLFPNLKVLSFKDLPNRGLPESLQNLLEMRFDDGRGQKLRELRIHRCRTLTPKIIRRFARFADRIVSDVGQL
ncbi:hypothetical protein JAAARDRAFT_202217 [Jaapia argillacea MUCL 33604]|uniref:F-box domain-containing protein n=1 Tax=Jaapia argillacea MUCL 33604 TaxID=933084 RepID=A0A067QD46_9AGAM|nr:hypothetical protein JAAARDRAFT_202217 [Jaapia argillacea MUCL 33604]